MAFKHYSREYLAALIFTAAIMLPGATAKAIIEIPEDYDRIQDGIFAAIPGDTILISPGTYIEQLEVEQKDLTLSSLYLTTSDTAYIANTILDGDSTLNILSSFGPHTMNIVGLTFAHGMGYYSSEESRWYGGAITLKDTSTVNIDHCWFIENYAEWYTGIYALDSSSFCVRNSIFTRNEGEERTNVIRNNSGNPSSLIDCYFHENVAGATALVSLTSTDATVEGCTFYENQGNYGGSTLSPMLLYARAEHTEVSDCIFRRNSLRRQPGLVHLGYSQHLTMNNCVFDSTFCDHALAEGVSTEPLVEISGYHVSLNNIRIADNSAVDGDNCAISIRVQGYQSLVADSIFIVNNHEEFEQGHGGEPGCSFGCPNSVALSHIYVTDNSAHRTDIDEYPDEYDCARYFTTVSGDDVSVEHLVKANNVNDYRQQVLGLYIPDSSPWQRVYLNDILIHDNIRLYTTPFDESFGWGSGITTGGAIWGKLEIENLRIYNQYNTILGSAVYARADTILIRNSHISDCGNGAISVSANHFAMENVLIHDCWNTRVEPSSHIVRGSIGRSASIRNTAIIDSYGDYGMAAYFGEFNTPDEKTILIENSIIDNTCPYGQDLGYNANANIDFTVRYSNIDGGWEGIGNIDADPLFTDPENNNYVLQPGSPCIDAGNPDPAYNDPEDPNDPGWPLWPAQGTLRNDMGCFGGPGAAEFWEFWEYMPVVETDPQSDLPQTVELHQNYPNPFNPTTTIEFTLPHPQEITLTVYNLLGQRVAVLAEGSYISGQYQVMFDGSGLASGVYVYQLKAGNQVETKKMVLVK